jgi:hypothetical protein
MVDAFESWLLPFYSKKEAFECVFWSAFWLICCRRTNKMMRLSASFEARFG